jgi:hypothetical protein
LCEVTSVARGYRESRRAAKSYLFIIQYSYGSVAIHPSELGVRTVLLEPGAGTPVPGLKKGHRPPGGYQGPEEPSLSLLDVNAEHRGKRPLGTPSTSRARPPRPDVGGSPPAVDDLSEKR